jgi:hypothetical protein
MSDDVWVDLPGQFVPAVTRLLDENEKLRADAERYRWLRNLPGNEDMLLALETSCSEPDSPDAFDAAIDAAKWRTNG